MQPFMEVNMELFNFCIIKNILFLVNMTYCFKVFHPGDETRVWGWYVREAHDGLSSGVHIPLAPLLV